MIDRKHEERKILVGKRREPVDGKPDRIRQPDDNDLFRRDQRTCAKNSVAQTDRVMLDRVTNVSRSTLAAEILDDVRLTRRNYKTDLVSTRPHHAFDQVFTDCTRTFDAVVTATANRKQFFGE